MIESASEQPASGSGIRTVLSGERIEAVSAMKCTPQNAIRRPLGGRRAAAEAERVADVVGDVLDLGQLVVVGEDHRVALLGERADLGLQAGDVHELDGGGSEGHAVQATILFDRGSQTRRARRQRRRPPRLRPAGDAALAPVAPAGGRLLVAARRASWARARASRRPCGATCWPRSACPRSGTWSSSTRRRRRTRTPICGCSTSPTWRSCRPAATATLRRTRSGTRSRRCRRSPSATPRRSPGRTSA